MAPHKPRLLCTAEVPSVLLYEDIATSPREVHWLDLSDGEPKPAPGKPVIHTQNNDIEDMCFVQYENKKLLIVADYHEGISAFNTETDEQEWIVCGQLSGMEKDLDPQGVTTDGRGHLFVSDARNLCVHVLSATDGSYITCLLKGKESPLGKDLGMIRWCEKIKSLILTSDWRDLKIINLQF